MSVGDAGAVERTASGLNGGSARRPKPWALLRSIVCCL